MRQLLRSNIKYLLILPMFVLGFMIAAFPVNPAKVSAAACAIPTTNFGTVTSPVNIPATGSYRVWSRIQIPTSASNSYLLEIDGTTCYSVAGNSALPLNTWVWVDYQSGSTANKINHNFTTAGNRTVKMIGTSEGFLLDRIIMTQDLNCIPNNITPVVNGVQPGDNCANPVNVAPTIGLSATPTSGTAPLNITLTATPADSDGTIARVEFFRNGVSLGAAKTSAPWTLAQTGLAAGTFTYTARVTDSNGATTTSSSVTVISNAVVTRKPGDANGDGVVDTKDAVVLSLNWGQTGRTFAQGNFNETGAVDTQDAVVLSLNWGK